MARRAAVIGAGVAGLVAALYLRRGGYEVTVFEKNEQAGGKVGRLRSNGYMFDAGPTVLTMPFVLEGLFADQNAVLEEYLTLKRVEPACRYHWSDGTRFDAFSDADRLRRELEEVFPGDRAAVEEFLRDSAAMYEATKDVFLFNPFRGFREMFRRENVVLLPKLARLGFTSTVHNSLRRRFRSPKLVQLFDRFATYNGSSPYRAPATLNVIPHVEFHYGVWYPEGGMYRVVESLVELAVASGIELETAAEVTGVMRRGNRITEVIVNDASHPFDVLVSNVDVLWTYQQLFEPVGVGIPGNVRRAERSGSGFLILGEVEGTHPELAHHNIFFSDDYSREFQDIFENRMLPEEMTTYVSIAAKSDGGLAPRNGENWYVLVNVPANGTLHNDQAAMEGYAEDVWNKLSQFGLRPRVTAEHLITPRDIEVRDNSIGGAIYGASSNSVLSAFLRPTNSVPGLENAFFAGGGSHPGGGVPLAVLSGKIAASVVLDRFPAGS